MSKNTRKLEKIKMSDCKKYVKGHIFCSILMFIACMFIYTRFKYDITLFFVIMSLAVLIFNLVLFTHLYKS